MSRGATGSKAEGPAKKELACMHARARSARMDRESACRERERETATRAHTHVRTHIKRYESRRESEKQPKCEGEHCGWRSGVVFGPTGDR